MAYDVERLIPKILDMYYMEEMSQDTIAKNLGISRTTVARNLAKAKELGYVAITLNYPNEEKIALEKRLKEKYQLRDLIISDVNSETSNIFIQAASYLTRMLRNDMTFGLTWGTSVKGVIENLPQQLGNRQKDFSNVKVVPLIGAVTPVNTNNPEKRLSSSNLLAMRAGEILNATSYNILAPMFISNPEIKKILEQETPIANVLSMARNSDLVLLGIGEPEVSSTLGSVGGYTPNEYAHFRENGAVGEMVGRMYDKNGACVNPLYADRIIGISLEEIRQIPIRIAIAYGNPKQEAIRCALTNGLVNVLITDLATAELL